MSNNLINLPHKFSNMLKRSNVGGIFLEVSVILNSTLKRYTRNNDCKIKLKLPEGTTIQEILDSFRVVPGEVGLIILNSNIASPDTVLNDKDELELYPIVGGG